MSNKKPIEIIKKRDNTIEVAIRKNPAKTKFGKVTGFVVIFGFVILPVIALIYALVTMMTNM